MKLITLRLALALAAFTVVPNAFAADSGGGNIFVDATYGKMFGKPATGYTNDSQSAWGADGGYRWKLDDADSAGFDVGYMNFGDVDDSGGNEGRDTVSASAISAGVNFQHLFGDDKAWIFQMRGGLMSVKFDTNYYSYFPTSTTGTTSSHQSGEYFGFGIGRDITQSFRLILALEYYSAGDSGNYGSDQGLDLGFIGLGAEYRF
ncbi:MAG TPA: hypothetical protein VGH91_05640 [Gammaproteobacteria bacterium]|jgi:hypothetical protein